MAAIALDDFHKLKSKMDRLEREAERAKGAKAQILRELQKEFKVKSVEEARTLLQKLEKQADRQSQEYLEAKELFTSTYGHLLVEEE